MLPRQRREFLRSFVRLAMLGSLAVASGYLITQRSGCRTTDAATDNRLCRSCRLLERCKLPQAAMTRNHNF